MNEEYEMWYDGILSSVLGVVVLVTFWIPVAIGIGYFGWMAIH